MQAPDAPSSTCRPCEGQTGISAFSDADRSRTTEDLVAYLDATSEVLAEVKERLNGLLGIEDCARWLDLGCGLGQDLHVASGGVGVDRSIRFVAEGRARWDDLRLAVAEGDRLPFAAGAFNGCRIERVLQHVEDPSNVLAEVHRVLAPGGRVGVFEPDWRASTFDASDDEISLAVCAGIESRARHGRIGRQLGRLLATAGFGDIDVVPDTVSVRSVAAMNRIVRFDVIVESLKRDFPPDRIDAWTTELTEREQRGQLWMTITRTFAIGKR